MENDEHAHEELIEVSDDPEMVLNLMKQYPDALRVQQEGCKALLAFANDVALMRKVVALGGLQSLLGAMDQHPDDASLHVNGCKGLCMFANNNESYRQIILSLYGVERVVQVMKEYIKDVDVQQQSSAALAILLNGPLADTEAVMLADGMEVVLNTMRRHPLVIPIQTHCCSILANVDTARSTVFEAGGLKQVFEAIRQHIAIADVQEAGCTVLASLAVASDAGRQEIISLGAVEQLVEALRTHLTHDGVQGKAFSVLRKLAADDAAVSYLLGSADVLERIFEGMQHHLSDKSIQEHGSSILRKVSSSSMFQDESAILSLRSLERILEAMRQHPCSLSIQMEGGAALPRLASVAASDQAQLDSLGGVERLLEAVQNSMSNFPGSREVQLQGCDALLTLASWSAHKKIIVALGGFHYVLNAMQKHLLTAEIQLVGIRFIMAFAAVYATKLVSLGGAERILDAMKQHPDDGSIQLEGASAIARLNPSSDGLNISDITKQIIRAMSQNPTVQDVQETGCGVIVLATQQVDKQELVSWGCVELVIEAMRHHLDVESIQLDGLAVLCTFADDSLLDREELVRLGGLERALQAMESHRTVVMVQRRGCAIVGSLAARSTDNRNKIFEFSGDTHVCASMEQYGTDEKIQLHGCVAIANLASFNPQRIGDDGGVILVLEAMRSHSRATDIHEMACISLRHLAATPSNKEDIVSHGGIEQTLSTLAQHRASTIVQSEGFKTLADLATDSESNKSKIASLGGVEAVLNTMQLHLNASTVQEHGCNFLRAISIHNDSITEKIGALNGIPRVIDAMQQYSDDTNVQHHACAVLRSLTTRNPVNSKTLDSRGGTDLIIQAMRDHAAAEHVQIHGCATLQNLASQDRRRNERIGIAGGIHCVLDGMQLHSHSASLQQQGCAAIWTFAGGSAKNEALIETLGGASRILATMRLHAQAASVQEHACAALQSLTKRSLDTLDAVASRGGVDLVVQTIVQHANSISVLQQACGMIAIFAGGSVTIRKKLMAAGSLNRILDVMRSIAVGRDASSVVELQNICSVSLRNLVYDSDSNAEQLVSAGGVTCMMQAMVNYPLEVGIYLHSIIIFQSLISLKLATKEIIQQLPLLLTGMQHNRQDPEVQWEYCRLLSSLIRSNSASKKNVLENHGLEHIVKAMASHDLDAKIQEVGCSLLRALAEGQRDKDTLAASGAVERILASMRQHYSVINIQILACAALQIYTTVAPSSRGRVLFVLSNDGVGIILNSMALHKSAPKVQAEIGALLRNLAEGAKECQDEIVSRGLKLIFEVINAQRSNKFLIVGGLATLSSLINPATLPFMAKDAVALVSDLMEEHKRDASMLERCFGFLRKLVSDNAEVALYVASVGGIERVLAVAQLHIPDEDVQQDAIRLLWALIKENKKLAELATQVGGKTWIQAVMKAHPLIASTPGTHQLLGAFRAEN